MDRDCSHCGCHHTDIKFKSKLRRKRHLVNKVLEKEIGLSNIKWFDDLTEQSIQRCSTSQIRSASNAGAENSPLPTRHSAELLQGLTPGGGSLTPLSTWAFLATQDTNTPKLNRPVLGISPAFVSTPNTDSKVKSCTDIGKELGLDNSAISWTSSMATPCLKNDTMDLDDDREDNTEDKTETAIRIKGFPRVLFTPDRAGFDSEDFGHILEVTRDDDDTLVECISPDSSLCNNISPSCNTTTAATNVKPASASETNVTVSPVLKRVNKRLSLGATCSFEQASVTPNKETKLSEDPGEIVHEETIIDVKTEWQVGEDEMRDSQILSPSSTNPIIVSVLSPFFDSPTSGQEKQRAAPKGVKRKAVDPISLDDELRMSSSNGLSQYLSQTGPQSILSSAAKRTASERKRVRFAADVEQSDKNSRLLRKGKALYSKDDSETVGCVEKTETSQNSTCLSSDTSSTCGLTMQIVNLNINNSCDDSEQTNKTSSGDVSNDCSEEDMFDLKSVVDNSSRFRVKESRIKYSANTIESVQSEDTISKVELCRELEKSDDVSHDVVVPSRLSVEPTGGCMQTDIRLTTTVVKSATSDELFSQVSPSAWNEMCQAANKETNKPSTETSNACFSQVKSVNSESIKCSKTILETEPENLDLCKSVSETEKPLDLKLTAFSEKSKIEVKKTHILYKPRKFLYPSGSQISSVSPQRIFNFHTQKCETNIKPDDVNLLIQDGDGKQNEEKTLQQEKDTDSVLCGGVVDAKPVVSPRDIGHDEMIKHKKTEQNVLPAKTLPRRRNNMRFTNFSEMFADEISDTDCDTRELSKHGGELGKPLKTPDSQIASKVKSSIHHCNSKPDPCSSVKEDEGLKNEIIVECKTQSVDTSRPSINVLSTEDLYSSEELEEKNDFDFDMNTQEVENFVKDAFLDDMEFSQISTKSGVNDDSVSTETVTDKTCADDLFSNKSQNETHLSKYVESPNKDYNENILNTTTQRFQLPSPIILSRNEGLENAKSCFHIIDDEVSIKCFNGSNSDVSKSKYLSRLNDEDKVVSNCDNVCTMDSTDQSTEECPFSTSNKNFIGSNGDVLQTNQNLLDSNKDNLGFLKFAGSSEISCPSFTTAVGRGMKVNKSDLLKAQTLLECDQDELKSFKFTNQNKTSYPSFTTAGGRGMKVNKSALQKAQTLLECELDELGPLKNSNGSITSLSKANGTPLEVNGDSFNKTLPPFHSNTDVGVNRPSEKRELETSKTVRDGQRIASESDIKISFVGKNFQNEKETLSSLESDIAKLTKFDETDTKTVDNFEEMLDSILTNKKKCAKVKQSITSMSRANSTGIKHGFETCSGTLNTKTNSYITTDSMLKPKGFRPFKKPKLISAHVLDPSNTNTTQRNNDKILHEGPQPLQMNAEKPENKEKATTDETEMSEIMLKEFCHDIFSQCPSQRFPPQNNEPTEDMSSSNIACSPTSCNLIKETTNCFSHSKDSSQSMSDTQLVDNVRKYKLMESDVAQVKVEANMLGTTKHEDQMSDTKCFLGQGFQMASGKKVHISENSMLKANKILADKAEPEVEALCLQSESSNFEKNDCTDRQSKDTCNETLNKIEDMQSSGLPLENSKSYPVQICPDFELSSKRQSPLEHLHPLLTDDTLFQDDMISNDSDNRTKAKECLLNSHNRESKKHPIPSTQSSYQANEQDLGCSAVQTVPENCQGVSNKSHQFLRKNMKDESNVSSCTGSVDISEQVSLCTKDPLVLVLKNDPLVSVEYGDVISIPEKKQESAECTIEDTSVSFAAYDAKRRGSCTFQTASGQSVMVSRKALAYAKSLWENDSAVTINNDSPSKDVSLFETASRKSVGGSQYELDQDVQDFQIASNKPAAINKSALQHAETLKQNESMFSVDNKPSACSMFQTALGKTVGISKTALDHARSMWNNESKEPTGSGIPNTQAALFQKASSKDVTVSLASLSHTKSLRNRDLTSCLDEKEPAKGSCMFQTALGSTVNVSKIALDRAKSLWNENDDGNMNSHTNSGGKSGLFQTAAGKSVEVSHKALAHAKAALKDEHVQLSVTKGRHSDVFQTASGRCVGVLGESLIHVSSMFNEESTFDITPIAEKKNNNNLFQTASGNAVTISESALKHTKKLFEENNSCVDSSLFQTASGNDVSISKEALRHVQTSCRLNEQEGCVPLSTENLFQTASGKSVCVSETALNYARTSMNDELNKTNMNSSSPDVKQPANLINGDKTNHRILDHFSDCHDCNNFHSSTSKRTDVSLGSLQNVSNNSNGSLPQNSIDRKDKYSSPVSSESIYNKNSSNQKECQKNLYIGQSNRMLMESVTSAERSMKSSSGQKAHSSITKKTSAQLTHDNQRVTRKKVLHSTPEVFYTDRWSGKGKQFVPLYSNSLSERSSEYTLESIVGKPEPVSAPSSFQTPYKKSPLIPTTEKPSQNAQPKKTKAPIFCPKAAIKFAQSNNRETILPTVSSENKTPSAKTSSEFKDTKHNTEVCHFVEARKKQEEIIRTKKKEKVRPYCGRMFAVKSGCSGYKYSDLRLHIGISVRELVNSGVLLSTVNLSKKTAENYRFKIRHFYPNLESHILVGDGAFLVADDEGFAGTEEFYKAFLTIKGVDPALVTDVWVTNHYKWIVWKLAAYEVVFPHQFGGRSLTPDSVMLQLKYRYDREIDHCQRSCLKKIIERDDTACKRLILCVAGIMTMTTESDETKQDSHSQETFLELTDGWYSIKGKMDAALLELVERQQIVVGQKLCISGAELGGSEDACPPLEAPASLFLKLSMNSTRPASWDSKMGYQRYPRPLCVAISSLHSSGGLAGCIDAVILRVYPVMYMEKVEDHNPIFRTAEAEERIQRHFDQRKQDKMEKLYEKIQAQFEQEENREHRRSRRKLGKQELENLQSGQEICEAVESSLQPEELHSWLSAEQQHQMEEYQRSHLEQRQQQLQTQFQKTWDETHGAETNRKVTSVMKIRIVGCARRDIDTKTTTIVTIWRPSPDWMEMKEGKRYMLFGLTASSAKTRLTSHSVHLTASRQSYCKECPIDENYLDLVYEPREVWKVRDLRRRMPPNKEFDFVGITVEVSSNSDNKLDTVYAADIEGDFIGIRFWGGVQSFGISDLLQEGKMFVGRNLLLKWSRGLGVVSVDACMEVSHFSHTSSSQEQRKCLDKLKSIIQAEKEHFLNRAKVKLCNLQGLQPVFTPENKRQWRDLKQPVTPSVQEHIDMDFLDNLPPECVQRLFSPMDESGNSQKESDSTSSDDDMINKQKSAIRSKVAKLLAYGSPKTLSPLNSTVSPAAFKKFKPPSNLVKNLSSIME